LWVSLDITAVAAYLAGDILVLSAIGLLS
jgi:hypothetical protein